MKDLEPHILRQRLIIEGKYTKEVTKEIIKEYLLKLGELLKMTVDAEPMIDRIDSGKHHGFYGYIHWIESGSHIYVWDNVNFLTVDIYTCKKFLAEDAINFTKDFFKISELVHKEIR